MKKLSAILFMSFILFTGALKADLTDDLATIASAGKNISTFFKEMQGPMTKVLSAALNVAEEDLPEFLQTFVESADYVPYVVDQVGHVADAAPGFAEDFHTFTGQVDTGIEMFANLTETGSLVSLGLSLFCPTVLTASVTTALVVLAVKALARVCERSKHRSKVYHSRKPDHDSTGSLDEYERRNQRVHDRL